MERLLQIMQQLLSEVDVGRSLLSTSDKAFPRVPDDLSSLHAGFCTRDRMRFIREEKHT